MIKILDQLLINKIAAGEVIERPASVVKELIENSIDAQATKIFIDLEDSGLKRIKIKDNGTGMSKQDAILCTERHATSKIKEDNDLTQIRTLGFRGEALAAISAVSRFTLITKKKDEEAIQLKLENKNIDEQPVAAEDGTTIIVDDLFFNTPARKNFLKSPSTELKNIVEIIQNYALINPNIFFKLTHNNKEILSTPKNDLISNIIDIYGTEIAKNMLPISYNNYLKIEGYISKPSITRADKEHQIFFINNRNIKDQTISRAIQDSYGTLLFSHRYPYAILNITINSEDVDVNVHPTKREVRFEKPGLIYEEVFNAIKQTLSKQELVPEEHIQQSVLLEQTNSIQKQTTNKTLSQNFYQNTLQQETQKVESNDYLPDLHILGQIHNLYIIAEDPEGLKIIDFHAAHERVLFEKFSNELKDKAIKVQNLLKPITLELSPSQSISMKDNLHFFYQFGFQIEEFGNNTFLVRTIPFIFDKEEKDILNDLLDELDNLTTKSVQNKIDQTLKYMACRGAVKQGDRVETQQLYKIITQLYKCETPFTCPHGRPTMFTITKHELEKKFKRI